MIKEQLFNQWNLTRKLKQLSVLFALMLMPIGAWGQDYGLTVGGEPVTSDNATSGITGESISGTITFDAATNTLILNNAIVSFDNEGGEPREAPGIEYSGTEDLTIQLIGENSIQGGGGCEAIRCSSQANPKPTLIFSKGDTQSCSLQLGAIENTVISIGFSEIEYDNVALVVEGVENPDYNSANEGLAYYDSSTQEVVTISSATITSYETYDIIVNGETVTNLNKDKICKGQVGSGHILFDGDHTLTLNNVPNIVFIGEHPFIQTRMNLTINIVGTSHFDCGNSVFITRMEGDNDTHTVTFTTDADNPGMLTLQVGNQFDGFEKAFENGLEWMPEGYYSSSDQNGPAAWVAIPYADYGLTVGGVAVTSANASDIRGGWILPQDGGSVSFNPESNVLTLNNVNFYAESTEPIVVSSLANLTVKVAGSVLFNFNDVNPTYVFQSTNADAVLKFITDDIDNPSITINTGEDYDAFNGFSDVLYENGLVYQSYEDSKIIGKLDSPYFFSSYNEQTGQIEFGFEGAGEIRYSIDYVDNTLADVTNELYEGHVAMLGPGTATAWTVYGNATSEIVTAKLFGIATNFLRTTMEEDGSVPVPEIVPAIDDEYLSAIYEGESELAYQVASIDGNELYLSGIGNATYIVKLQYIGDDEPAYTILNSFLEDSYNVGTFELTVAPPAPVVTPESGHYTRAIKMTASSDYVDANKESAYIYYQVKAESNQPEPIEYEEPVAIQEDVTYDVWVLTYVNDDAICSDTVTVAYSIENYNLWVNDIQVNSFNKNNILDDETKTVRFDNTTNTLTLNNADIDASTVDAAIKSELPALTVNLTGSNSISCADGPVFQNTANGETEPQLTFTTDGNNAGKLSVNFAGSSFYAGFSDSDVSYENDLCYDATNKLIAVQPVSYGLTVAGTEVTNVNADNVLGDNTVSFETATSTLTLNNAALPGNVVLSSVSSITTLTVMLKGNSTTTGIFESEKSTPNPSLVFDINVNNPGSLTFVGKTSADEIQSGFGYGTEGSLLNGLTQGSITNEDNSTDWKIATFIPIAPIVNEEETVVTVTIDEDDFTEGGEKIELINIAINDVLYTLPAKDNEGFDNPDGDSPGVIIASGMTDTEVEDAINAANNDDAKVGTDKYAENFHGITLMAPAGEGTITFDVKSLGGTIRIKVGDGKPYSPEVSENDYTTVTINYIFTEPTFIYIYLLDPDDTQATARGNGPIRGKVLHGTVKVSNYTASCSMLINNNQASVYGNAKSYSSSDGSSMSMSNVNVNSGSSLSRANGPHKNEGDKTYPIVELGPHAFDDYTAEEKQQLLYIDLSGTQIKDLVVNREGGVLNGFGDHTLIYLPDGNDDGEEPNVIVGDNCKELALNDAHTFLSAPNKDFTAAKATLNRKFTDGQTSTLFLPFIIPVEQAGNLGTFYTFKEIQGAKAVFNDAETGEIPANTPFIFVPKATSLNATEVSVKGFDATTATSGELIGTYEKVIWDSEQTDIYGFAASAADDDNIAAGEFVRAGSGAFINPFRAYLKTSASAARLQVVIEGESSGIADMKSTPASGKWFTLGGQALDHQPSQKGIYIHNGRKEIVK